VTKATITTTMKAGIIMSDAPHNRGKIVLSIAA
jgi:hypothetical protein